MGSRFGRNKKREMLARIAELEEEATLQKYYAHDQHALRKDMERRYHRMRTMIGLWEDRIIRMLGPDTYARFTIREHKIAGTDPSHIHQMMVHQPLSDRFLNEHDLPTLAEMSVPFEGVRLFRMLM